jgi:hypothetical protein
MVVEFAVTDSAGALLGSVTTNVLVDSGADLTMLNADIAAQLGLDINTMTPDTMGGIGGSTTVYKPAAPLLANLCGRWVSVPVCFEPNRNLNLLGRPGAFESMSIVFLQSTALMLAYPV